VRFETVLSLAGLTACGHDSVAPSNYGGAPDAFAEGAPASLPPLPDASSGEASSGTAAIDVGAGAWPAVATPSTPAPMDGITVFAFSQVPTNETDPQVPALAPDMNIRAWQRWDTGGTTVADYDAQYVTDCHARHVAFVGGTTATALFKDEGRGAFEDWASRDANGNPVDHAAIISGLYRGTLANPAYRGYLVGIGKIQIDLGVDGLFFDELYGGYQGATYDGNEGFDDYHLADFNAYLLSRYAGQDFGALFGLTQDNTLHPDVAPGDLTHNFNYRTYLASRGWSQRPLTRANPLAAAWGTGVQSDPRGPTPGAPTFTDAAEPYRYFRQMAAELRDYAQAKYGRPLWLTANGIWPLVDFQGVGLYDYNHDGPGGASVDYVPLTDDTLHLRGTSLQQAFVALRARSQALAPGAPVVVFVDWPSGPMTRYQGLAASEKQDYWRMYAAEAYANGIFFAFFLADTTGDPTATQSGTMPLFQSLAAFYRAHASLYHGVAPSTAAVTTSLATATTSISVMDQATPARRLVHVVNHDYAAGFHMEPQFTVSIPSPLAPTRVTLATPDGASDGGANADSTLPFTYSGTSITVTVPSLLSYDVVVVTY
jgi:hypothetical protein